MISKTLAIIGAGDLGMQIAHYAINDHHYKKVVFIDDFNEDKSINGFEIIGKTNNVESLFEDRNFDELIIGIGYKHLSKRKNFYEYFISAIPFGKIIHSSSWVDQSATVKEGCVVFPSCSLDINSLIGANSIINNGCTVAHDSVVGKHNFISPRVAIAGFVKIGDMCNLGINATIIDGITIVDETQVGGGGVVINNIQESGLYVGNPSRFIR